jgi:hypothetical protein
MSASERSERSRVRLTIDMPPALHRRLKQFANAAALELDVVDVPVAVIMRTLATRLTLRRGDEGYDLEVEKLVDQVMADIKAQLEK